MIVAFISAFITYFLGLCSQKCKSIKNEIIPLQNLLIMLITFAIYYYATGDISLVVASGSPVATLIYDTINSLRKSE